MSPPGNPPAIRRHFRPLLITGVVIFIITQIVAFSPSQLEQGGGETALDPKSLLPKEDTEKTLASGIPKDRIPEYTIDDFHYVSTQGMEKQWELAAKKAFLYNKEKIVHARTVTAHLFDSAGQVTLVTGNESKYLMNERDLEVFGNVVTKFPDGFETKSEYLRYFPNTKRVFIPNQYWVNGEGQGEEGSQQKIQFRARGVDYDMNEGKVILAADVSFTMTPIEPEKTEKEIQGEKASSSTAHSSSASTSASASKHNGPQQTTIESDHCVIFRKKQLANFTMYPSRPLSERFVQIRQPTLYARSRTADLSYGNFAKLLQYLTAYTDVLIKEKNPDDDSLRYATGGRADFDTRDDLIILREFPQVYQDRDTVTGDIVIVHRDTDVVEVEHSNAFSTGQQQQPTQKPASGQNPKSRESR